MSPYTNAINFEESLKDFRGVSVDPGITCSLRMQFRKMRELIKFVPFTDTIVATYCPCIHVI